MTFLAGKIKEISLLDFHSGKIKTYDYNIYVLKAWDTVSNIGKSLDVCDHWFGHRGRLFRRGKWFVSYGDSAGQMVADNPMWKWRIQL